MLAFWFCDDYLNLGGKGLIHHMNPVNNKILKEMMNKGLCVKPGSITRRKRVFRKLKQVFN